MRLRWVTVGFFFVIITFAFMNSALSHEDESGETINSSGLLSEGSHNPLTSSNEAYFSEQFGFTLDNIFWGEFHSHSKYSMDAANCGALTPDRAYQYGRDTAKLSFVALCDHAEMQNAKAIPKQDIKLGLNNWQSVVKIGQKYNNEDSSNGKIFIVFPAWEYTNTHGLPGVGGSIQGYGHKNVVFKNLDPALLPQDEYGAFNMPSGYLAKDADELWEKLEDYRPSCTGCEGTALTIVHTPANVGEGVGDPKDHRTDWGYMDFDFVRHVEIYSKWGCSEGPPPAELGCPTEKLFEYTSRPEGDPLSIRSVLYENWVEQGDSAFLLGFLGGTDNHKGQPGNSSTNQCDFPYRGGITGILSPGLTREKLWSNLWERHTLATSTGARMAILFAAETGGKHLLMGEEGGHNGTVRLRALANPNVQRLEVIVDGCVRFGVDGNAVDETLTLSDSRHYIYIRASTHKGANNILFAWTSPVYLGARAK